MSWIGWWSIRDPKKRAAAKAADELRLAAAPPPLPVWDDLRGPHSFREESDALVYIRGNVQRFYVGDREFARLAALAGLPSEITEYAIVADGDFFIVTTPRGNRGYFQRRGSVSMTRTIYRQLAMRDNGHQS